jgi:predicted metalloprotease with PDZ domain
VQVSHPEVRVFIDNYISGSEPLPFAQYFNKLGYDFSSSKRIDVYFAGKMGLKYDDANNAFAFTDVEKGNALGIKEGDFFLAVEKTTVTQDNLEELWEKYFQRNSTYTQLAVKIKRNGEEKELNGQLFKGYLESKNFVGPVQSPTSLQTNTLNNLIKN